MGFFERLMRIDRRIIFAFIAVAVAVPLFFNVSMYVETTAEVRGVYSAVDTLSPGSKVLISFDYDPGSMPELQPMAESFFRHCFAKDLKVIVIGLWPQGPLQANWALHVILNEPDIKKKNLEYGVDYVNLGYTAGNEVVIQRMGSDIHAAFPTDSYGTPIDEIPIMKGVRNFDNIDFVYNLSAGYPGTQEWVQFAADRFHAVLGAGTTAVQAPLMYPFLGRNQLVGILGGMKGAAEYEVLANRPARGVRYMFSQGIAHAVVVFFVIIGNIAYFATRKRSEEQ